MYVGKHYAGCRFYDALKNVSEDVIIDDEGFGWFTVNDGSVSVYIPKKGTVAGEYDEEYTDPMEVGALDEVHDDESAATAEDGEEKIIITEHFRKEEESEEDVEPEETVEQKDTLTKPE